MMKYKNLPPLGAHTSISGGHSKAIHTGAELGCDVIQIFSKNQMQWRSKPLQDQEVKEFREAVNETRVLPMAVHVAYLINLASPEKRIHGQSMEAFTDELRRCEQLEIPYLIMHPGSHMDSEPQQGLDKIAKSIDRSLKDSETSKTMVLLESTAGQGTNLGYTFEQLQYMIDKSTLPERIAVCIDTCHIFTAGYDIRDAETWSNTKKKISRTVGLTKIKTFHMNDSKKEFGSKRDRHERIGQGEIGLEGFRQVVNDPDFKNIPMILEIPGGNDAYAEDLKLLRSLLK